MRISNAILSSGRRQSGRKEGAGIGEEKDTCVARYAGANLWKAFQIGEWNWVWFVL